MKEITEQEALSVLMQTYQSNMSMLYAASIGIAIGLFVVPLFALNASINSSPLQIFGLKERLMCFVATLILAVGAVYCVNKTIFLGALQWETLTRVGVADKEKKSIMKYHSEMKAEVGDKYPIFKYYKISQFEEATLGRSYELQVLGLIALAMVALLILFSFIWWKWDHFFWYLLGSELIYGLSIWLSLRYIPVI